MKRIFLLLSCIFCSTIISAQDKLIPVPSNNPAEVILNGKELVVKYDSRIILTATIEKDPSTFYLRQVTENSNDAVTRVFQLLLQIIKILHLKERFQEANNPFPCEAERKTNRNGGCPQHFRPQQQLTEQSCLRQEI